MAIQAGNLTTGNRLETRSAPAAESRLLHAVVNPTSGNGRAGRQWESIAKQLASSGYLVEAQFTRAAGHATEIARQWAADGAEIIVAVGGDGTVNEIINGLVDNDRLVNETTKLALIPCGTGRDLARTLGTQDVEQTLTALQQDSWRHIDLGRIRFQQETGGRTISRYFANVADLGLGAATAARINRSSKRLGGFVSYLSGAVRTISTFKGDQVGLMVDGVPAYAGNAHMIVFANGRYFAGGMHIAPSASLSDGSFDIFVLKDVSKATLLTGLLPRVYLGKHLGHSGVLHLRGSQAIVETSHSLPVEMDGEQPGVAPVQVEIVRGVLPVFHAPERGI
jgi:YegS/Rv2252/BmrU family lipid kinase